MEATTTAVVMSEAQVTAASSALTGFGNALLDGFIDLLPAIAGIAVVYFIISIIRRKVKA